LLLLRGTVFLTLLSPLLARSLRLCLWLLRLSLLLLVLLFLLMSGRALGLVLLSHRSG